MNSGSETEPKTALLGALCVVFLGIGAGVAVSHIVNDALIISLVAVGVFHVSDIVARTALGHEYHKVTFTEVIIDG